MGFYPFALLPVSSSQLTPPIDLQSTGTSPVFGAGTSGDTNNRAELDADGGIRFGPGNAGTDTTLTRTAAGTLQLTSGLVLNGGGLDINLAGKGVKVAEGANAKQGTFTLSGAATTVVANTSVTANSRIFLQTQALGTVSAASTLAVSARTAGTSFTVTPSQSTDTSTVAYEIFEPG